MGCEQRGTKIPKPVSFCAFCAFLWPNQSGQIVVKAAVFAVAGKMPSEKGSATVPVARFGFSPNRWGGKFHLLNGEAR